MEWATWAPAYETVLADMGYDRADDERARDVLLELVGDPAARSPSDSLRAAGREGDGSPDTDRETATGATGTGESRGPLAPADLDLAGATVAVAAPGPSLPTAIDEAASADAVVAASRAAGVLEEAGVGVDWIVTDLDGDPTTARRLATGGTRVAVHAHGDNVSLLREHVPRLDPSTMLPTTQAEPRPPVVNLGGFTDGDRAAFLADHAGAAALRFPGWDLEDPGAEPEKRRKLRWAGRLLSWLERRRGERFEVLDGHRVALAWSPPGTN